MDVGLVRERGAVDCLGDRGPAGGGLVRAFAIEWRRPLRLVDPSLVSPPDDSFASREATWGDAGGVTINFGSRRSWADLRVLIVSPADAGGVPGEGVVGRSPDCCSRVVGGADSSGEEGATIGAARASGDDTEEGVDDRVVNWLSCCWRVPKVATED